MTDGRTWEHQDPQADAYLIDPGPNPTLKVTRKQQRELRTILDDSRPGPMRGDK